MTHITNLGFDLDDLIRAIADGDVRSQTHPEFPELSIFNYTEEVQYRNKWNKITLATRGLIVNTTTGEVVARPWEKFFNFGQMDNRIESTAPVEVTDKVDGSLGIMYRRPDGVLAIATRGSFASEQALEATAMLHEMYRQDFSNFEVPVDNETFLFEIIYPENRIVVNYGDQRDLILLGAVNKRHGYYHGPDAASGLLLWNGPVTEVWHYDSFVDALSFPDRQGKEGVVIRSGTNIVKLKQADYVELHRIVTNLSPKTIWQMLRDGKTVADICAGIPDEFHGYVEKIGGELVRQFATIKMEAFVDYANISTKLHRVENGCVIRPTRKQWAEEIKKSNYPGLLFMSLDDKPIDDVVWKMIQPRGDVKSLVTDEG